MIRHIVLWRLAATDPVARVKDVRQLRDAFAPLPAAIEGVRSVRIDGNVAAPESNFDVVLTVDLDDLAALARYQQHPAHLAVAELARALTTDRAAVDVEA